MDLPFGQGCWCGAEGVEDIDVLSDHHDANFSQNYGVLIKEIRPLTPSVFVWDEQDKVRYVEYVPEGTDLLAEI